MRPQDSVDAAVGFIENINRRNFDRLRDLMAHDHEMIDDNGEVHEGRDVSIAMIREYTEQSPDFQIHISDVHLIQDVVVIIGRTTGSCADKAPGEEIREKLIHVISIQGGLVTSFEYALEDTYAIGEELGLDGANRITG